VATRSVFPAAQTSTSKLKALLLYLDARAPSDAEMWLRAIKMDRSELEDETGAISVQALKGALVAFTQIAGREAIQGTAEFFVAPKNIAPWMRVLRGAGAPEEAFGQLDGGDSECGRTTRWETVRAEAGHWRGRVHISHDPNLEDGGLLGLSRAAELASIPALYGFGSVEVEAGEVTAPPAGELRQDFVVRWSVPNKTRAGALGAFAGAAIAGVPLLLRPSVGTASAFAVAAVAGALAGIGWARDRMRRGETVAQAARVQALERGLSLKEGRAREAAGSLEGTVVAGHYKILERMGSGASGVIYKATRISDGVPVAIKLLRAAAAHDTVASDRLRREAEALGLAWHPNVVEVLDHGHLADGTAYLVMELLSGESLATRLRQRGRMTPAELIPIALQVTDALTAVHAAGVVHRDIKPSNIFLSPDAADRSAPERVKILDFGIARVEWEETRITNMGAPLGTAGYMSPEQESGGEVDARSDLFSLGAVLYECLVGEPPPAAPTTLWSLPSIAPGGEQGESGVQTVRVPPGWRELIARAVAPKPEDRFPDARSFSIALRALRDESMRPSQVSST
jgi:serine/threonine-protein kinase